MKYEFKNKQDLLENVRGCFDYPYNHTLPTIAQNAIIRNILKTQLRNSGGYQVVSNSYGQVKEVRFDNLSNPMNAAYLFQGIAGKLNYPFVVEI